MRFSEITFFNKLLIALLIITLFHSCSNPTGKNDAADRHSSDVIDDFLRKEPLSPAIVGLMIADAKTGEVFIEHNPDKSLVPASVQKLMLTAAALETLGTDYTFNTTLVLDGKINDQGTFTGNILIRGGGDPALGSERFGEYYQDIILRFAEAIHKRGIKTIDGQIIGDASFFGEISLPRTWLWEDIGNYFGAATSGLNIYENTYCLNLRSGQPGSLTKVINVDPEIPELEFKNNVTASTENRDNAFIFGSYLSSRREIRGTIPANRSSFTIKGAIPDPAFLAAYQLTEKLEKSGVKVSGTPKSSYKSLECKNPETILTIKSPPLSEIIYYLNMNSINLYAETLLLHLSKSESNEASCASGCKALTDFWKSKGMPTDGLFLLDGSGLSRAGGVTARQLIFMLRYMKNNSENGNAFIRSMPVAGISGSLKNFGKETELQRKFIAKSGYMTRVMNYAGYLTAKDGKELVVVVLVNNYTCPDAEMKRLLEDLMMGFKSCGFYKK